MLENYYRDSEELTTLAPLSSHTPMFQVNPQAHIFKGKTFWVLVQNVKFSGNGTSRLILIVTKNKWIVIWKHFLVLDDWILSIVIVLLCSLAAGPP